jgi:hypothetical protein
LDKLHHETAGLQAEKEEERGKRFSLPKVDLGAENTIRHEQGMNGQHIKAASKAGFCRLNEKNGPKFCEASGISGRPSSKR